jgi:hypothetical protein
VGRAGSFFRGCECCSRETGPELAGAHRDELGDLELGRLRVQFEETVDDVRTVRLRV